MNKGQFIFGTLSVLSMLMFMSIVSPWGNLFKLNLGYALLGMIGTMVFGLIAESCDEKYALNVGDES
jgi:hypothetical protein